LPYAFTEQGVAMLSSVLRSQRAIRVNVEIMRAFVRLRRMLVSHDELAQKVATLERRYDGQFKVVFEAISEADGAARGATRDHRLPTCASRQRDPDLKEVRASLTRTDLACRRYK
jgi:hypothetical protein